MKKYIFLACSLALLTFSVKPDDFEFNDDFADLNVLTDAAHRETEAIRQLELTKSIPAECFFPASIIVGQLAGFGLPKFLGFNAYAYTNPIVIRSLHDLPSLKPWYGCGDSLCFYGTLFYNQMNKAYLTKHSPKLKCYLSLLHDDDILEALEMFGSSISDAAGEILPLFNNILLEQRRIGIMIGASKCFGNWRCNVAAPLYYLEHNFFLSQQELDALQTSSYFADINNVYQPERPEDFITHHLVSDKIGLGDFRFYGDYTFFNDTRNPLRVGAQLTLPNSSVINRAINGNSFNPSPAQPPLSFTEIAALICQATGTDPADPRIKEAQFLLGSLRQSYAVLFLDRLAANLAENSLGQRQVSYGLLLEYQRRITDFTAFHLFFEWDQFVQGAEKRMVKLALSPGDALDRNYDDAFLDSNPTIAQDDLTFFQQQAINILYPPFIPLKVKQGDIIKARAFSATTWHAMEWMLGFDVWYQAKEILTPYCNTFTLYGPVDIPAAARPSALQGKLFGQLTAISHKPTPDTFGWRSGLRGELTTNSFGIGKDWLVAIDFIADF